MNLFYLDHDIKKCVMYHCDKHIVKMITETAQLISNVHHLCPGKSLLPDFIMKLDKRHSNSPHARWLREDLENYFFLCKFGLELYKEYQFRYKKKEKHQRSLLIFCWAQKNLPNLTSKKFTTPPIVMPEKSIINNDIVFSYRNLYMTEKRHFMSWKSREKQNWFV